MTVENSNFEHECNLLNQHELSRSQKHELQRFIDQNSHLLRSPGSQAGTGDSSTWAKDKDKREDRTNSYQQNYGTLSISPNRGRKEVKWSDDVYQSTKTNQRTSSLSPNWSAPSNNHLKNSISFDDFSNLHNSSYKTDSNDSSNKMSNYGNTGYMNRGRDNQFPTYNSGSNYQSYGKHPDDYNRYETARSRSHASQRQREEDERSRFSGYGDRPGSGVEFMPTKWHGGEIITDPEHLPRSLKPRRLYYSPIGDGVVAADGVELKRLPKDLSPKVTITHRRTLDRGEPGHDGYNIYTRTTTTSHGNDYGNDGSGRDSRLTGGISPGSDSFGQHSGVGPDMGYGGRDSDYKGGRSGNGGGSGAGGTPFGPGKDLSDPGGRGVNGYGAGIRDTDSYVTGSRGLDFHGTGSPNYRYHSPTAAYQYSPPYHDPYSTRGFTHSDPLVSESRGRSQSADLLNGPDSYGDYGRSSDGSTLLETTKSERYQKFDVTKDYLITNPRELIHQYATTTPVSILEIPETSSRTVKKMYSSTTEEKYVPYPPYKGSSAVVHPNNFARQLRDEEIRKEASRTTTTNKEIDHLTEKMMYNLQSGQQTPLHY